MEISQYATHSLFRLYSVSAFLYLALPATGQEVRETRIWWPPVDWTLENPSWEGNPFDVLGRAIFTHEDGVSSHVTELFYVDNHRWKFRFTGTKVGKWTYRTESADPELNGHAGNVTVRPNADPNVQGFLTHVGNQYAVQTGNDAHLEAYPFTVFMDGELFLSRKFHKWDKRAVQQYCELAKDNGCEIIFIHVNSQWFKSGVLRWDEHENDSPDLDTFARLEHMVTTAHRLGCRVHFWAWGDESRRWTPLGVPGGVNGEADRRLQRYIAARLGPLPGWTMGYGFDLHEWVSKEQLYGWADFLHEHFGWQHLLAARGVPLPGKNNIRSYDGFGQLRHGEHLEPRTERLRRNRRGYVGRAYTATPL